MILFVGWVVLLVLTGVVQVAAFSCEPAGEWKIVRLGQLGLSLPYEARPASSHDGSRVPRRRTPVGKYLKTILLLCQVC